MIINEKNSTCYKHSTCYENISKNNIETKTSFINPKTTNEYLKLKFPENNDPEREMFTEITKFLEDSLCSDKKFIIINAPTGIGKSHIAAISALTLGGATILTDQKSLQKQYVKSFPWILQVKGKPNFKCAQKNWLKDCSFGNCENCEFKCSVNDFHIENQNTENEKITIHGKSKFKIESDIPYIENIKKLDDLPENIRIMKASDLLTKEERKYIRDQNKTFIIKYKLKFYMTLLKDLIPQGSEAVREKNKLLTRKTDICTYFEQLMKSKLSNFAVYNYQVYLKTSKIVEHIKCDDQKCGKTFPTINRLFEHRKGVHQISSPVKCMLCKESETSLYDEDKMQEHVLQTHGFDISDKTKLLICDEAHMFPAELLKAQTSELDLGKLSDVLKKSNISESQLKMDIDNKKWLDFIQKIDTINKHLEDRIKEISLHTECIKFLESDDHINLHRDENNCVEHKKLIKDCDGCKLLIEQFKNGSFIKCDKHKPHLQSFPCQMKDHTSLSNKEIFDLKNIRKALESSSELIFELKKNINQNFNFGSIRYEESKITLEDYRIHIKAKQIFDDYDKIIFLSSTLHRKYFPKMLNLPDASYIFESFPGMIPKQNRPITKDYAAVLHKILKQKDPGKYDRFIEDISKKIIILVNQNQGKKGLILVGAKDDRDRIIKKIEKLDLKVYERLTHSSQNSSNNKNSVTDNEKLIEIHRYKDNSVLISPSMWNGINLVGKLGEFCIIATAPYKFHDGYMSYFKSQFGEEFYTCDAAFTLVQGWGRCIRSTDDFAETHLIDGGIFKLINWLKNYCEQEPNCQWMIDGLEP